MDVSMILISVAWILVGIFTGWINSAIMRIHSRGIMLVNEFVGAAGAQVGGWMFLLENQFGINRFSVLLSLGAVAAALAGAMVVLLLINQVVRQYSSAQPWGEGKFE